MLNTALQVLSKDGTIADNTYQLIGEDGVLPQGDVVLTVEQLDQLENVSGKKALYLTVDASPETNEFPLDQLDAIFIEFAGFNDGRGYSFAAERVPDVVEEILNTYLDLRQEGEEFVETYRRVGIQPFKERAYA